MSAIGMALIIGGGVLLMIAALGLIVLPDALSRQHAATKAGTLSLTLILIGTMLLEPSVAWAWRLLVMLAFLLATLPVASHLLARAAVREAGLDVDNAPLVERERRE